MSAPGPPRSAPSQSEQGRAGPAGLTRRQFSAFYRDCLRRKMLHGFMKRRKWRLHHLMCGRCARPIFVIIPRLMQIERCAGLAGCNFGAAPASLPAAAAEPARSAGRPGWPGCCKRRAALRRRFGRKMEMGRGGGGAGGATPPRRRPTDRPARPPAIAAPQIDLEVLAERLKVSRAAVAPPPGCRNNVFRGCRRPLWRAKWRCSRKF